MSLMNFKKENKNRKAVVITGSSGRIGSILQSGLADFSNCYLVDVKEKNGKKTFNVDISKEYNKLVNIFKKKDIVLHLAWDFFEDFPKDTINFRNKLMAENVYRAAVEAGVKRVIMASSVHANDYALIKGNKKVFPENSWPDSPYGASKIYIESLGRYFSRKYELEVICIRFGGVNSRDRVIYEEDPNYDKVLLYKKDCIDLIKRCIEVKMVPDNFQVFAAVSNNKNRVHSINNFLAWKPKFPQK